MSRESFCGKIPDDRLYDPVTDMWVLPDDDCRIVTIGATAYGLHLAGKVIGFTSKPKGSIVERDRGLGTIESAKTVLAIHAPIGFELMQVNEAAEENPELLNCDPYGTGWMVRARPLDWKSGMGRLVTGQAYRQHIRRADPDAEFL